MLAGAVTSLGSPLRVTLTMPPNPFIAVAVIVNGRVEPAWIDWVLGVTTKLKSGEGGGGVKPFPQPARSTAASGTTPRDTAGIFISHFSNWKNRPDGNPAKAVMVSVSVLD